MRTIKFRGKRVNRNGEWAYGDLRQINGECFVFPQSEGAACDRDKVIPDTVGQFTGLLDDHGEEIYEGNILFVREWKNLAIGMFDHEEREQLSLEDCKGDLLYESQRVVYFEEGSMCAGDYYISTLWDKQDKRHQYPIFEVEVIGNIHDNPELLKQ